MKKLLTSLCVCALALVCILVLPTRAEATTVSNGVCGENLTWSMDVNMGILTIEGSGDMQYYTSGQAPWFIYKPYIKEIVIKEGVISISEYAFSELTALKSVVIPASIAAIKLHAFLRCTELEQVYISNLVNWCRINFGSYTANPVYYASNLYLNGQPLTDLIIPSEITSLGYVLFANCDTLKSVRIPDGVTLMGEGVFDGCSNLTTITIPGSVTTIGRSTFSGCSSLKSINLPDNITAIGRYAFSSCNNLKSITIPNGIVSIGESAFAHCDSMTSVVLPVSLRLIERDAFWDCPLQHVLYKGSLEQWEKVTIVQYNSGISNASIVYNATDGMSGEHTYSNWETVDSYNHEQICTLCNKKVTKSHRWDTGFVTEQPTCGKEGVNTICCTVCNGTKTELIPKLNIHTYDNACDASCNVCGKKRQVSHSYTKQVTKPTCTAKGYTTHTCDCGDSYVDTYVKSLGHSYKSGSCTRCKHKPIGAKIITEPKNVVVASGKTAKVTVKATGDGLKYTWYYAKKGSSKFAKTTVTAASYSVKMSSSVDGRKVYCVVTDKYGNSVKSSAVTLYKGTPAKITTQPKSVIVAKGKTGELTIKASGSSLSYTWYAKNKGATSYTKVGKSSKTYSFKMASKLDGCQVYCVVKDKYGITVKSSVVTIKQAPQPKITTQPKSVTQVSGKTVKFTVKASGEGLKYQWYYAKKGSSSFKKLSGKTSATYSVKVSSSVNGRKYYCLVTDKYGQTVKSSAVTLTMKTVAKITTQPKSVTAKSGAAAKVTVKATGDGLTYTWYYAQKGAAKWSKSSITKNVFSVKMVAKWNGCKVYCVVKDKYGTTVKTNVVALKLK